MRRAIESGAGLQLVGEAVDGSNVVAGLARCSPEVAVISDRLPGLESAQLLRAVAQQKFATQVVLLSGADAGPPIYAAILGGAAGYISTEASGTWLCRALVAVAAGESVVSPDLQQRLHEEIRLYAGESEPMLNRREREVLNLAAAGCSNAEIGKTLSLSTATIKTHLQASYRKLDTTSRAGAVAEAIRRHLID